jgi:hypothetical protein
MELKDIHKELLDEAIEEFKTHKKTMKSLLNSKTSDELIVKVANSIVMTDRKIKFLEEKLNG